MLRQMARLHMPVGRQSEFCASRLAVALRLVDCQGVMAKRPTPGGDNEATKSYRKSKPWADLLHSAVKTHGLVFSFLLLACFALRTTDLDESEHPVVQLLEVSQGEMQAVQAWLEGLVHGFPDPTMQRTPVARPDVPNHSVTENL